MSRNPSTAHEPTISAAESPVESTAPRNRRVSSSQRTTGARKTLAAIAQASATATTHGRSRQRQAAASASVSSGVIVPSTSPCATAIDSSATAPQRQSRTPASQSAATSATADTSSISPPASCNGSTARGTSTSAANGG